MKAIWIFWYCAVVGIVRAQEQECDLSAKPKKLEVVGVWMRRFDNSTAQYRISDEDLSIRGYERVESDKASSTVMMARHPEGCVISKCGVRLTAMMQKNGAILHTDHEMIKTNNPTMDNIEDEFYCARKNNSCGADVPVYRLVQHSVNGPHYAYTFDNSGQSLPGYEKEFFPLCYAWRQTPSVVLFNTSDDAICLTLPNVENGKIVYSTQQSNIFSIGTTAGLHCLNGYSMSAGPSSLLCTKNGWYPKEGLGTCIQQKINATKFMTLGSGSALQSDGPVSDSSCKIPQSVANGQIVYSANVAGSSSIDSVPTATRASVLCNIGFISTSTSTSSKCVGSAWQPALPTCVSIFELKCPILSAPTNGELVFNNSSDKPYSLGSVISLKCDRNYFGLGNMTSTCLSSGWDNKIGHCEPISTGVACSALPTPANGNIVYMQSQPATLYSSGTTAYLMCNLGMTLQNSISSMCQNGVWTPTIGTCGSTINTFGSTLTNLGSTLTTIGSCTDLSTPANGIITYSSGTGTHTTGSTAIVTCNIGYTISGSSSATCNSGMWSPMTLGTCVSSISGGGLLGTTGTTCVNPTVLNGIVSYSQGTALETTKNTGTVATVTCNLGYTISGTASATCYSGTWTPTLGTCNLGSSTGLAGSTGTTCANPTVLNGIITYSQGTALETTKNSGTVATLTCNLGYTLSGTASSTCYSGTWSPTLGTCNLGSSTGLTGSTGATCVNPTVVNGIITYSQGTALETTKNSGTIATLTCNLGYTLSGTASSTCSSGLWSPALGTCSIGGLGTTSTLQCAAMIPPFNGRITYSTGSTIGPYSQGTIATASCNSGTIQGTSTATCQNGMWTPAIMGMCSLIGGSTTVQCSAITVPTGAQATYSPISLSTTSYSSGTVATVTCTSGGTQLGTSTCTNGLWSPAITSACSGVSTTTCTALTRPLGETVTYSGSTGLQTIYNSGTIATVTCMNGTSLGTTTCLSGQWVPALTQTCSGTTTSGTQCVGTIVPANGQITYSDGSNVLHATGVTATLTCLNNAVETGSSFSSCQNGAWTPTIGTCSTTGTSTGTGTGQCLSPPLYPTGATITYSSGLFAPWTSGSTATMSCPLGQTATGTTITYCQNSIWTPALGTCGSSTGLISAQGCTPINALGGTVTNGQMTYTPALTTTVPVGTIANIVCFSGYSLSGSSMATCTSSGWSPSTVGSCVQASSSPLVNCLPMATPTFGSLVYSSTGSGTYSSGTSVTLFCNPNYTPSSSATSSTCRNGVWSPIPLANCQQISNAIGSTASTCGLGIAPVLNANVVYSNNNPVGPWPTGTIATATCSSGFVANGVMSASCVNGIWSPATLGTCTILGSAIGTQIGTASCGRLAGVLFGTITYSALGLGPYPSGTSLTVICNLGTTLTGAGTSICTNGIWTPLPGACTQTVLKRPPTKVSENMTLANDIPETSNRMKLIVANGTVENVPIKTRSGVGCPPPIAPAFGEITFSQQSTNSTFEDGTNAALRCNLGYKTNGASFSTCRKGSFRPIIGKCVNGAESQLPGICVPLSPPPNARIVYIQTGSSLDFEDGTTALLYCEEGFAVTGSATLQCQGGQWEPASGFGMCDSI